MQNFNHNQLTDGRLGVQRGNIKQLGESNYLVSNDGVQTMELPRNMLGPKKHQGARSTPLLIPPIKYIVYNNPQVAYDFLISKNLNVEPTIPSTYQFARIFVKENGDQGILEFVAAAHPDKETIVKALGLDKKESNFDGDSAPAQTTTTTPTTPSSPAKTQVTEAAGDWIKLNQKTIIIVLAVIIFFLLINRASK